MNEELNINDKVRIYRKNKDGSWAEKYRGLVKGYTTKRSGEISFVQVYVLSNPPEAETWFEWLAFKSNEQKIVKM